MKSLALILGLLVSLNVFASPCDSDIPFPLPYKMMIQSVKQVEGRWIQSTDSQFTAQLYLRSQNGSVYIVYRLQNYLGQERMGFAYPKGNAFCDIQNANLCFTIDGKKGIVVRYDDVERKQCVHMEFRLDSTRDYDKDKSGSLPFKK